MYNYGSKMNSIFYFSISYIVSAMGVALSFFIYTNSFALGFCLFCIMMALLNLVTIAVSLVNIKAN